jgi:conjugal transfer pilus assembly protein TraW
MKAMAIASVFLLSMAVAAQDIGPTYPIVEKDMVEEIERSLRHKERTGELSALQKEAINRAQSSIERPKVVTQVPKTVKPRTRYFDPSFVVPETIKDHEGRIIALKGSKVNPLDYVAMSTHLVFIDGDDTKQVRLSDQLHKLYKGQIKTVLVRGAPLELTRRLGYQIYFDQGSTLTKKLDIAAVPSLVSQEGNKLRIDELEVK